MDIAVSGLIYNGAVLLPFKSMPRNHEIPIYLGRHKRTIVFRDPDKFFTVKGSIDEDITVHRLANLLPKKHLYFFFFKLAGDEYFIYLQKLKNAEKIFPTPTVYHADNLKLNVIQAHLLLPDGNEEFLTYRTVRPFNVDLASRVPFIDISPENHELACIFQTFDSRRHWAIFFTKNDIVAQGAPLNTARAYFKMPVPLLNEPPPPPKKIPPRYILLALLLFLFICAVLV